MSLDPPSKKRGRPSLDAQGAVPVSVSLSTSQYQQLQRAAKTLGLSIQDVVRLAVKVNLSRKN